MIEEYTGGSVSYYRVKITHPTSHNLPSYEAECNDIIEALGMNYAEGNAFKALWRRAAARLGNAKRGYTDGLYDAEKVVFFGQRLVAQESFKPTNAFQDAPPHATHKLKSPNGSTLFAYQDAGHMRDCHTQYKIDTALFSVVATRNQ